MEIDENYQNLTINEVWQIIKEVDAEEALADLAELHQLLSEERSGMKIIIELDNLKELDLLRRRASQADLASEVKRGGYTTDVTPSMLRCGDLIEEVFADPQSGVVTHYKVWRPSE